jgi:hypothetical protein
VAWPYFQRKTHLKRQNFHQESYLEFNLELLHVSQQSAALLVSKKSPKEQVTSCLYKNVFANASTYKLGFFTFYLHNTFQPGTVSS